LEDRSGRLDTDPQFVVLWSQRSIAQLHICLAHGLRKPPHDTRLRLPQFGGRRTKGLDSFKPRWLIARPCCRKRSPLKGRRGRLKGRDNLLRHLGHPRPLNASRSHDGGPGQFRLRGNITSRPRRRWCDALSLPSHAWLWGCWPETGSLKVSVPGHRLTSLRRRRHRRESRILDLRSRLHQRHFCRRGHLQVTRPLDGLMVLRFLASLLGQPRELEVPCLPDLSPLRRLLAGRCAARDVSRRCHHRRTRSHLGLCAASRLSGRLELPVHPGSRHRRRHSSCPALCGNGWPPPLSLCGSFGRRRAFHSSALCLSAHLKRRACPPRLGPFLSTQGIWCRRHLTWHLLHRHNHWRHALWRRQTNLLKGGSG